MDCFCCGQGTLQREECSCSAAALREGARSLFGAKARVLARLSELQSAIFLQGFRDISPHRRYNSLSALLQQMIPGLQNLDSKLMED